MTTFCILVNVSGSVLPEISVVPPPIGGGGCGDQGLSQDVDTGCPELANVNL